jgi:hypothetical protein
MRRLHGYRNPARLGGWAIVNLGNCPYDGCAGVFMLETPDRTPVFAKLECETCGRPVWYRFSRVDPEAWTEPDFLAEFEIDEATKRITRKAA